MIATALPPEQQVILGVLRERGAATLEDADDLAVMFSWSDGGWQQLPPKEHLDALLRSGLVRPVYGEEWTDTPVPRLVTVTKYEAA